MKVKQFSIKPEDFKKRSEAKPIVCYPNESLEDKNLKILQEARKYLKKIDEIIIPARDAKASGSIIRSNFYPNCSYMTNWVNLEDTITWDAEVAEDGDFEVIVYYTCAKDAIGSEIELSFSNSKVSKNITKYYDPDEYGKENDRSPRIESYVKDFIPLNMGIIKLEKGKGTLVLKGLKKNGEELMDFRLLMLKRI